MRERTGRLRAAPAPADAGYVDVRFLSGWAAGHVLASPRRQRGVARSNYTREQDPCSSECFSGSVFPAPSFAEPSAQSWHMVPVLCRSLFSGTPASF